MHEATHNSLNDYLNDVLSNARRPYWKDFLDSWDKSRLLIKELVDSFPSDQLFAPHSHARKCWEAIGAYWRASRGRIYEAIALYTAMYHQMQKHQLTLGGKGHKGVPLVWLSDCYISIGNITVSKYFLMLTLVEDSITTEGDSQKVSGWGSSLRLALRHGMSEKEIKKYIEQSYQIACEASINGIFPEDVLLELDQDWLVEKPSQNDMDIYVTNDLYMRYLMGLMTQGNSKPGTGLERLAHYLVSRIPGCRTIRRARTHSTEYDVLGVFEGPSMDFRSEIGRYFLCECKDWNSPVDFSAFAKFARVLDSVKAKFGIIFARKGITGEGTNLNAAREQLKLYGVAPISPDTRLT